MDNILRLFHHLAFGNPQCRFGNGCGKIVDFYSIKLPDGYFNWIQLTNTQRNLPSQQQGQRLIFQLAQGQIGFRMAGAKALIKKLLKRAASFLLRKRW